MHTYVSFIHALFFSCIYIHWYIHTHSHIPNRCQSYSASHCNRLQYTATHRNIWMRHVTLTPCQSYSRRTAIKDDCITRHATHMNAPPVSYAATHCNTLYHTATDERVTQQDTHMTEPVSYAATHCNTLQDTATDDSTSHTYEWAIVIFCNTLQHTATNCNTLQHTATHCNTLQHMIASHDRPHIWMSNVHVFDVSHILHHAATRCNTLQHAATHCNILQHMIEAYSASHCDTTQHTYSMPVIFCIMLQHTATRCNTLQHTVKRHTAI